MIPPPAPLTVNSSPAALLRIELSEITGELYSPMCNPPPRPELSSS